MVIDGRLFSAIRQIDKSWVPSFLSVAVERSFSFSLKKKWLVATYHTLLLLGWALSSLFNSIHAHSAPRLPALLLIPLLLCVSRLSSQNVLTACVLAVDRSSLQHFASLHTFPKAPTGLSTNSIHP